MGAILVVTFMKIWMVLLMILARRILLRAASFVLRPFLDDAHLKLMFVMLVTPMCMNAFQFYVVDNIIKYNDSERALVAANSYDTRSHDSEGSCRASGVAT